jgi:hypothetical protein
MRRDGPHQSASDFLAGFLHAAPFAVIATSAASFCGPAELEATPDRRNDCCAALLGHERQTLDMMLRLHAPQP